MLELKLRVDAFCKTFVQKLIDDGGFDYVVPFSGTALFYAGASKAIIKKIQEAEGHKTEYLPNWVVAKDEAKRLNANRIDDTKIFPFLMSKQFAKLLKKECDLSDTEVFSATQQVWDYVSERYSRTAFKKAATLVCGASKKSSFYEKEMFGLLDVESLEAVNEKPVELFKAFRVLGKDETLRVFCLTDLLEMKQYAKANNDSQVFERYKRQRKYFVVARREEDAIFNQLPKDARNSLKQARKEILNRFKAYNDNAVPMLQKKLAAQRKSSNSVPVF